MDENNLSDNMAQIAEALNRNTEMLNSLLAFNMAMVPKEQLAKMNLENNIKGQAQAFDVLGNSTRGYTRIQKDSYEAAIKYNEAMTAFKAGLDHGQSAVDSFTKAITSGERSYSKYEGTLKSAADAVTSFTSALGPNLKFLGVLAQGAAKVGSAYFTQADNVLKASDQLSKFGNAGAFTGEELLKLAHQSGVTSKNLDLLVKPLQSMGPGLVSLGNTVGDGTKAFARLTAITTQQREAYNRLGVSQGELIQNQADYIKLQTISGRNLSARSKDEASLRQASLEYTDNLLTLSALSGKDIETIKKENEAALSREETLIQTNLMEMEINRLRKTGLPLDEERAKKLEAELKARDALLVGINNQVKDPKMVDAMSKFLATGAVTQESAMLARMGVPIEEFAKRIKNGEDVTQEFLNSLKKQGDQTLQNVGVSAMHNKEVRESFGYSKEFLQFLGGRREKDEVAAKKEAEAKIKAQKEAGKDPMQDTRAKMVTAEIEVATKFDEIVLAGNPLIAGFDRMTLAIGFASVALTGLVTVGLTKFGNSLVASGTNALAQATGMGRLGAAAGAVPTLGGAAPAAAGALPGAASGAAAAAPAATRATSALASSMSALSKTLGSIAKVAGSTAGVAGMGTLVGGYQAYSGYQDASKELKEGKITEEEANKKKGSALGEGAGTASGTVIGAAIGTAILPGIGTAIGGALGGWLGGKGGQLIGEKLGEKVSTLDTAKSDLAKKEKEIVDAKAKQDAAIADQKNATTAEEKAAAARGIKYWEEKLKELETEKTAKEKIKNKEEELQQKEEKNKEAQAKKEEAIQKAKEKIVEAEAKYAKSMETASLAQKMGFGREADQKKATDELSKAKAELGKMSNRPASSFEQKPTETPTSGTTVSTTSVVKQQGERKELQGQDKIDQLERRRTQIAEQGPRTQNQQSIESHEERMKTLDMQIAEEKRKLEARPKAAEGGIFSGPKSGYPVELHGNEAVIPLSSKTALPDIFESKSDNKDSTDSKEEKENAEAFSKSLKDSDIILKRMTGTFSKWNEEIEYQLELKEEENDKLEDFVNGTAGIKDGFKNTFIDLTNFNKNLKVATRHMRSSVDGGGYGGGFGGERAGSTGGGGSSGGGGGSSSSGGGGGSSSSGGGGGSSSSGGGSSSSGGGSSSSGGGGRQTSQVGNDPSKEERASMATAGETKKGVSEKDLADQGIMIKSGDVQAPNATLDSDLIQKAKTIQNQIPGFKYFSSFNDRYHKEKHPNSKHALGKAIDFTLTKSPTPEEGQQITDQLKKMGFGFVQDEYNNAKSYTTGGHIHAQLSAADGGITSGPSTGYPATLHGNEVIVPLDANSILEKLASTPAIQTTDNATSTTTSTITGTDINDRIIEMLTDKFDSMIAKLDDVINELSESNNTQSDLLKYSKI